MTKKELLEAIKDMPEDAEVYIHDNANFLHYYMVPSEEVDYDKLNNRIIIC